jgi:hypothetical protein
VLRTADAAAQKQRLDVSFWPGITAQVDETGGSQNGVDARSDAEHATLCAQTSKEKEQEREEQDHHQMASRGQKEFMVIPEGGGL